MKFSITPQNFNAVMACSAINDVRFYLNTFFIDTTNNRMVATNGHVLAYAAVEKIEDGQPDAAPDKHSADLQGFLFERLPRPISNKGDLVVIDCANLVALFRAGTGRDKESQLEFCDAKYPDYTSVLYNNQHNAVERIAFNAEYIAKPARWAGFDYCLAKFEFNDPRKTIGVAYLKDLPDVHITLMPGPV